MKGRKHARIAPRRTVVLDQPPQTHGGMAHRAMGLARLVLAGLVLVTGAALAGDPPPAQQGSQPDSDAMCKATICQHGVHVTLKKHDGSVFDRTFDVMPGVVQPLFVTIIAGQSINIEADKVGDGLEHLRVVDVVSHPEKTLTFKLEQADDGGMLLTTHNPFDRLLKFNMGVLPLESERVMKTSSCPVMAGKMSMEMWPYPIFEVVLSKARFVDETQHVCD
jgi:hypothetical protein